jgi:acetyl-CoA carboxylase biotin carboxyl carrier protein|tara:strand:- start:155 stop:589 length:435 start_codon:yes stop_codon:yes gene_type:complete
MDLRKVKKLIELVEESGISELEVSSGDESIRIVMPNSVSAESGVASVAQFAPAQFAPVQTAPKQSAPTQNVIAPMAGVFYQAVNPEAQPFVALGQQVTAGEVLCIIESMKMMNEITAVHAGTVTEICVANGDAVATGSALFKLL